MEIPTVNPRRPYDDDKPDGYLESLNDWVENNQEAVEWFLENRDALVAELKRSDERVILSADEADTAENQRNRTIAKLEELRAEIRWRNAEAEPPEFLKEVWIATIDPENGSWSFEIGHLNTAGIWGAVQNQWYPPKEVMWQPIMWQPQPSHQTHTPMPETTTPIKTYPVARYFVVIDRAIGDEDGQNNVLPPDNQTPEACVAQLAAELQEAFDAGLSGNFKIITRQVIDASEKSCHEIVTCYR